MKIHRMIFRLWVTLIFFAAIVSAQNTGDYRSNQSGDWSNSNTWEEYNGSSWVWPASGMPDTLYVTTIRSGHNVDVTAAAITYVGASTIETGGLVTVTGTGDASVQFIITNGEMVVNGTLAQTGGPAPSPGPYAIDVSETGSLVFASGGTFKHDQNGGRLPSADWEDGSTLLITGYTNLNVAPGNSLQSFYNVVWNCPNQTANINMGWHPDTTESATWDTTTTVRGNFTVLSTGTVSAGRVYFCGPDGGTATHRNVSRIIINGDLTVRGGATCAANGTSKAYTDIYVTVLGNINVRDSVFLTGSSTWQWSQLAISRGTQGSTGTTTWYIKSDSVYYGRKTTNANSTEGSPPPAVPTNKGKFIFCKPGTQVVTLDDSVNWGGPCNMQFGDGITATVVEIGNSPFIGSGCYQRIKQNATVIVGPDGYIGGGTNSQGGASNFSMDAGATLKIASQAGIRATGMGSSGAVRVSGNRDYGTASNYEYNGTANQRLGSGFPTSVNDLTINNLANVYPDSTSAFTVNGILSVLNGDLELDTCEVTLGPTGQLAETPGNTCIGTVQTARTVTTGVDESFGGIGVKVNASGSSPGVTTVTRVTDVAQSGNGNSSILRYFDIVPTVNTALNASLEFSYDASELNSQDASSMLLWKSTDDGASWVFQPSSNNAPQYKLTATGIGSFSRWTGSDVADLLSGGLRSVVVNARWNMISLPYILIDTRKNVIFPSATSPAWAYNAGYVQKDTLGYGIGYWLKFPLKDTVEYIGFDQPAITIPVRAGWNMIGSISSPIVAGSITSDPPGMVTGSFFAYNNGYVSTDTIYPGKGYWIKVPQEGTLTLTSSTNQPKSESRIRIIPTSEIPLGIPDMDISDNYLVPSEYVLEQNFPNPFNPSTKFTVAIPEDAQITIAIYDILGEKVKTLLSDRKAAGYFSVEWDGSTDDHMMVSSGVYLVKLTSEKYTVVRKIMMMK